MASSDAVHLALYARLFPSARRRLDPRRLRGRLRRDDPRGHDLARAGARDRFRVPRPMDRDRRLPAGSAHGDHDQPRRARGPLPAQRAAERGARPLRARRSDGSGAGAAHRRAPPLGSDRVALDRGARAARAPAALRAWHHELHPQPRRHPPARSAFGATLRRRARLGPRPRADFGGRLRERSSTVPGWQEGGLRPRRRPLRHRPGHERTAAADHARARRHHQRPPGIRGAGGDGPLPRSLVVPRLPTAALPAHRHERSRAAAREQPRAPRRGTSRSALPPRGPRQCRRAPRADRSKAARPLGSIGSAHASPTSRASRGPRAPRSRSSCRTATSAWSDCSRWRPRAAPRAPCTKSATRSG